MSDNLENLESRLEKLEGEYRREIAKMVALLERIQQRLVGSIDADTPGLIGEVRDLHSEAGLSKAKIQEIAIELSKLAHARESDAVVIKDLVAMKTQLPILWKKIRLYDRYRWLIMGGIVVFGYVLSKVWEVFMKMNP